MSLGIRFPQVQPGLQSPFRMSAAKFGENPVNRCQHAPGQVGDGGARIRNAELKVDLYPGLCKQLRNHVRMLSGINDQRPDAGSPHSLDDRDKLDGLGSCSEDEQGVDARALHRCGHRRAPERVSRLIA